MSPVGNGDRPPGGWVVDHLVWATPGLAGGCSRIESLTGVRPVQGGRHEGIGTHNALLPMEGGCYLEIIARDPDQRDPDRPRPFQLDDLDEPRLVTWAVRPTGDASLEETAAHLRLAGLNTGEVSEMSRVRPDGTTLRWRLSDPWADRLGSVFPFLIDWGTSPHPSDGGDPGVRLLDLRLRHPEPRAVRTLLCELGMAPSVDEGPEPALAAFLDTPRGRVTLI